MQELISMAMGHPLVTLAFLSMNSVAVLSAGIWLGIQRSKFVTKEYFKAALAAEKAEASQVDDDMAQRYQKTMEDTASRVKEIFEEHTGKVAGFLRGVAEEGERTRKTLNSLTKDTYEIKGALAVLLPKGAAKQVFKNDNEEDR